MSGHTHIHTYTHDNYYNPRCAIAHRGLKKKSIHVLSIAQINAHLYMCIKTINSRDIKKKSGKYYNMCI